MRIDRSDEQDSNEKKEYKVKEGNVREGAGVLASLTVSFCELSVDFSGYSPSSHVVLVGHSICTRYSWSSSSRGGIFHNGILRKSVELEIFEH